MTTTPPDAPDAPDAPPGDGDLGPQQPPGPPHGPRTSREEMKDLGRLRRSASDRKVAGVAGGLARHLDIDPLVLRVAFVVLAFFGGAGLIVYGACWLLVPDEETDQAAVTLDERSRTIALLVVGALAVFALVGDSWGYFWFPWPLAIIALIVFLVLNRKDRHGPPPGSTYAGQYGPYGQYAAAPPAAGPTTTEPSAGEQTTVADSATAPAYTYTAPAYTPPTYTPPRDSKRRGPKLFWFTIALVTLAMGLLGTADVAGADVADSAYPALAVGLIGAMLLVGAFFGRAGGLILLGLLATIGLAGATAADNIESDPGRFAPTTSTAVQDTYEFGVGELVLDLTELSDPENLDGRTLDLQAGLGSIDVIVPRDMTVEVDARIGGVGDIQLFGGSQDGIDIRLDTVHEGTPGAPYLTIDVQLGVGEIRIWTEK